MALIVSQHFRWPFFVIFQKFLNFSLITENEQKLINLDSGISILNLRLAVRIIILVAAPFKSLK